MTYKVRIGYKVWESTYNYTFHEVMSGAIERDSYNYCTLFVCDGEYFTSETIEKIFQKVKEAAHGLMDALVIYIGGAEFHGIEALEALEEVAGGSSPYEILQMYKGNMICEQPYRATH